MVVIIEASCNASAFTGKENAYFLAIIRKQREIWKPFDWEYYKARYSRPSLEAAAPIFFHTMRKHRHYPATAHTGITCGDTPKAGPIKISVPTTTINMEIMEQMSPTFTISIILI